MIYPMPPFVWSEAELSRVTDGMRTVVEATERAQLGTNAVGGDRGLESDVWREAAAREGK